MADISGRDGETLSDEQTFGGSGTLAQFVASERRSMERAVGVIGAYVAEERREMLVAKTSGDEAQARFNSINADCVEHFLAETAALRAERDQAREWAQSAELARAKSSAEADQLRAEVAGLRADKALLVDAVRIVGTSSWDAPGWTLHVEQDKALLLFDIAYNHVAEPRLLDSAACRELREKFNARRAARAASGEDASHDPDTGQTP